MKGFGMFIPLRLRFAFLAGCVSVFVSSAASAHSYYVLDGQPIRWFGNRCVRFLSPATFPPGSEADLHVRSAMGEWNRVAGTSFVYSFVRPDQDYPIDHFDGLNDTAAVPSWQLDPGVLGVTYLVNYGPEWFDTDILFSDLPGGAGYSFDVFPDCEVVTHPPTHGYSFLLIALHELGHGLGLGHDPLGTEQPGSSWFVATMNPRYPSGGPFGLENIIELHADDRNGIRFLYPHSGPSMPRRTDLAAAAYTSSSVVGRAVPIFVTPTEAYPGEVILLRAGIENLGTTNEFYVQQSFFLSGNDQIEPDDLFLGSLRWDLAIGDALSFDVNIPLPADMAAGSYFLGSILDDLDEVAEEFEDNNAAACCEFLTIKQLSPTIQPLGQHRATCGRSWTGPTPSVTLPSNTAPLSWTLDNPETGMTVDRASGVVRWPRPQPSPFLYTLFLRAANEAGSDTEVLFLGVDRAAPVLNPRADETIACGSAYASAVPILTAPDCMNPILLWSLDTATSGLSVNPSTGVVSLAEPLPVSTAMLITLRASNSAGSGTTTWQLRVSAADFNGNGTIDRPDLGPFLTCLKGPDIRQPGRCACADLDGDSDVDLKDISALQRDIGR